MSALVVVAGERPAAEVPRLQGYLPGFERGPIFGAEVLASCK